MVAPLWGVTHQAWSGVMSNKVITNDTANAVRKGIYVSNPPVSGGKTMSKPYKTEEHITPVVVSQ